MHWHFIFYAIQKSNIEMEMFENIFAARPFASRTVWHVFSIVLRVVVCLFYGLSVSQSICMFICFAAQMKIRRFYIIFEEIKSRQFFCKLIIPELPLILDTPTFFEFLSNNSAISSKKIIYPQIFFFDFDIFSENMKF